MKTSELFSLLEYCTRPEHPFYRELYGIPAQSPALSLHTLEEWAALPFVTKKELSARTLKERSFLPMGKLDHIRASSGTSGKPPLFCPRTLLRGMGYRTAYHDFSGACLAFGVPAMPHWHQQFQQSLGKMPRVVVFDPLYPAASVRLARAAGVDHISLFAFQITSVGEHMLREGIADRIRLIELCGESCSRTLFEHLKETFPNATIIPFYGSTEVEDSPMGFPCRPITGEEPLALYHAKSSQHHELIDPESGNVLDIEEGTEGELVVTSYPGEPAAFPLLRFRTGDKVRAVKKECSVHGTWSFTVLGRIDMDFAKIPGGVLRIDETERVLRALSNRVSDRFELHRYERETPEGPKVQVEIHVETGEHEDLLALADEISGMFRVNATTTYADAVRSGRYLPLLCKRLSGPVERGRKAKRLIQH